MMANHELSKMLDQYMSPLKSFAYGFTRNVDDADDLYQDTVLKALQYFDRFNPGTNLKAWLFTIMRNTFINDYRRGRRKTAIITTKEDLASSEMLTSSTKNGAEGQFIQRDINKMLAKLPESYAVPFTRHFEGYKYHEIADELNIPIGTVKTRIHFARELLKKHLKPYA